MEGGLTVIICHEVPEIEVTVHFSYTQLFVILWTTRRSDLHRDNNNKTVSVVDHKRKRAVSKKR